MYYVDPNGHDAGQNVENALKKSATVDERNKFDIRNYIDTHGARNDTPLTEEQKYELIEYAKKLGFPEDKIYFGDEGTTSNTGLLFGEQLLINNDVLPTNKPTNNPNSLVSGKGTIAHEVIGHYETIKKGTAFEQFSYDSSGKLIPNTYNIALDEAQASIRAARFAPDLSYIERIILIKDALKRLAHEKLKISDVRHLLDITER